jgi:hypothetical protein
MVERVNETQQREQTRPSGKSKQTEREREQMEQSTRALKNRKISPANFAWPLQQENCCQSLPTENQKEVTTDMNSWHNRTPHQNMTVIQRTQMQTIFTDENHKEGVMSWFP